MSRVSIDSMLHHADLPPLPQAYFTLSKLVDETQPSHELICSVIREEPGLEVSLLRIANSAMFQFATPCTTIDDLVATMALPQIRHLVLAVMVVNMLAELEPDIVSAESHWNHSIACGVAARALAMQRGEGDPERFFVAGLLHDIGSMLFYVHIPEQSLMAILHNRNGGGPLHQLERSVVGFDHAQLGGALLNSWGLPNDLSAAVAMHHTPELAKNYAVEAAAVHLADIMVNAMELGSRGEFVVSPIVPEAWDSLGLTTDVLAPVMQQADAQFSSVAKALFQH